MRLADECVRGSVVLNADHPPLEGAEFSQPPVISLTSCEHLDTQTPGAHRNQRIAGEPTLSNLFITIAETCSWLLAISFRAALDGIVLRDRIAQC
jgi:hypothetical protein